MTKNKTTRHGPSEYPNGQDKTIDQVSPQPSKGEEQSDGYKVGPGHPPREHQFRPGQSGNPMGRPKKDPLGSELRDSFERALRRKAKITEGDRQRITTWAQAGLERLVHQYAQGDRHARRDLFWLADRLGIDIRGHASGTDSVQQEIAKTLLDRYVQRHLVERNYRAEEPILAPPELLDDDPRSPE